MNAEVKKGLVAISIYIIWFAVAYLLNISNSGGPCGPGLGILSMVLLPPVVMLLVGYFGFKLVQNGKLYRAAFIIHLMMLLTCAGFYVYLTKVL